MDAGGFVDTLSRAGIKFFTGVPDSYLHGFCSELKERFDSNSNVIAANEGNAIGIAVGHYLSTGEVPLVYMQNSGLGNAVNPLASLACREMLGVPIVLLVGWRGDPMHRDHVQHHLQGKITPTQLELLEIPYIVLGDEYESSLTELIEKARRESTPVGVIVPKGVLNGKKQPLTDTSYPLSREEAICAILDAAPSDAIYSATTGRASRELYHVRESRNEGHECDYLNVGSMGHASSVALGLALGSPRRRVICLDGDAAVIMHMGALTMPSNHPAPNLLHIVLNNGMHESVGGQPSAGQEINLTAIAAACGYSVLDGPVSTREEIAAAIKELCGRGEAAFLDVRIRAGIRPDMPGLEIDPKRMRDDLMRELEASGN